MPAPHVHEASTPYRVLCQGEMPVGCGQKVFLTKDQYTNQMMHHTSFWKCPVCGSFALWDDENYERHLFPEPGDAPVDEEVPLNLTAQPRG